MYKFFGKQKPQGPGLFKVKIRDHTKQMRCGTRNVERKEFIFDLVI